MKIGEISTIADPGPGSESPEDTADRPLTEVASSHYEFDGVLARGGVGIVLKARDRRLRRQVAVKQVLRHDDHVQARFEREALLTARLQHPGIVPIYEAGRWPSGESFYAMRLVAGRPLSDVIADLGTLDDRLALLPKVIAVSEAVAYAHTERVLHRDLKPHNVVIGPFGEVVVIDWGLAKDLAQAEATGAISEDGETGPTSGSETAVGSVVGTPAYMPPEQARGEPVDERADVYSLGATLYHLLTGAPPFTADNNAANLRQLLSGPPPAVNQRQPGVPRDLAAVIGKAMAREPRDRYADAGELSEDLHRFVTGQLVQAHRYPRAVLVRRSIRRHPLAAATGVFALVLALVGGLALRRIVVEKKAAESRGLELLLGQARALLQTDPTASVALLKRYPDRAEDREVVRAIALDAGSRGVARRILSGHVGGVSDVAFTPDGSLLASAGADGSLFVWNVATGVGERIHGTGAAVTNVAFDPSGRYLAASLGTDLAILMWDRQTRKVRKLPLDEDVYTIAFSRDGILAAGTIGGVIHLWSAVDGSVHALEGHSAWMEELTFSPDGRTLLSVSQDQTARLWTLSTGAVRILQLEAKGYCGTFSPDGGRIAVGLEDGTMRLYSVADPALPARVWRPATEPVEYLDFSPDGAVLAWAGVGREVHVVDLGSNQLSALHGHEDDVSGLAFLPDATLVTASADTTVRHWDLASGVGSVLRGHTDHIAAMSLADGGRLLATAGADRDVRIWPIAPAPTTYQVDAIKDGSIWRTPANDVIYLERGDRGISALDLRSQTVRVAHMLRPWARVAGAPDGQRIAYRDLTRKVSLVDVATSEERPLPPELELVGAAIEFSPDGAVLAFPGWKGIHLVNIASLTSRDLPYPSGPLQEGEQKVRRMQFSRDGRRILTTKGEVVGGQNVDWDLVSGRSTIIPQPDPAAASYVIASPDLDAVAASTPGGLWLLDRDRRHWRRLLDQEGEIFPIAFSPDGSRMASADEEGHLRVWRVADGTQIHELIGHQGAVRHIEFAPDGGRLVSAGRDGAARLWDVDTGEQLRAIRGPDGREVQWAGFHGRDIVTAGRDGTVRVWPPVEPAPRSIARLLDGLTAARSAPRADDRATKPE